MGSAFSSKPNGASTSSSDGIKQEEIKRWEGHVLFLEEQSNTYGEKKEVEGSVCIGEDMDAAQKHQIVVTNVPSYGTPSVVQMVFAHLLNHTLHVQEHSESVHAGQWTQSPNFCY